MTRFIPRDYYSPHGYLDNPYHSRNANPSGVIRSTSGMGFGWHFPALARGYGYQEIYHVSLNIALTVAGKSYYQHQDFPELYADLHTKNLFRYCWKLGGLSLKLLFWRVGEHALACRLQLESQEPQEVTVTAFCGYRRQLGAAGVWGESGLVGRCDDGCVILQGFEDGEAFALAGNQALTQAGFAKTLSASFIATPTLPEDHLVVTGRRGDRVELYAAAQYQFNLEASRCQELELVLARAIRRDLAIQAQSKAMSERALALAQARQEDEVFWHGAPQLKGSWPEHWRRGFVTDLETLRMMVKAPLGIYTHPWDAMQIQAPRVVLAEAAIDALLLGYADLEQARAMLLGTFLDAPAANIPCSREDGSYNMVGANGSECGTAPEWGYPTEVVAWLYDLDPEPAWLEAIYPALKAYLEWWLEHRSDEAGYLVYDNSWESGQDLSERFGPQKEGGGSTIRMLRPVDLQAAMARACQLMARFADILGLAAEQSTWDAREQTFRGLVMQLWHDGAFRDYDQRVGWSDVWDVMQLAPLALGLASEAQQQALEAQVLSLAETPYLWPMFVWTATEAARVSGHGDILANIVYETADRAYHYWDSRDYQSEGRLPGITCEYWGTDGICGAEGYGWGAFNIHLIIHGLFGFQPLGKHHFSLMPNLPLAWMVPGQHYTITNLRVASCHIDMTYKVSEQGLEVLLSTARALLFEHEGQQGNPLSLAVQAGQSYRFSLHEAQIAIAQSAS